MAVGTYLVGAVLSDDAKRIELRAPCVESLNEFFRTLPDADWDKQGLCWTCEVTPAAAWRITNHCPEGFDVEADAAVLKLSAEFTEQIRMARLIASDGEDLLQPSIRKADAWQHQLRAYHFANCGDAAMLSMAMGTGKSLVAVNLVVNRNARRTIILCPCSVLGVWRREFAKWAATPAEVLILDDKFTVKKKQAIAAAHLDQCEARGVAAVVVVNYESAWRDVLAKWILAQRWDCGILDESHRGKNHASRIGRFIAKLRKVCAFRLCLTGTPMPHSPLDLFAQLLFLDPGLLGTSYHRFRNQYAISGHFGANHIVGFKNQAELAERAGLITFQVAKDVLDLPPVVHQTIEAELTPKARKVYDSIEDEFIAEVESGKITVANALVKILRLQQITSGYVPLDDEDKPYHVGDEKRDMLEDILDALPQREPVVVFCRFRTDLDNIRAVAEKLHRRYGELSGRQKDLTENATMPEGIDVLGVQIASGGVGIDLTRACYCVYYSVGYSLGEYEQSLARVHRPGQTRPTFYYHLRIKNSIDETVGKALDKRRDVVESVLRKMKGQGDADE